MTATRYETEPLPDGRFRRGPLTFVRHSDANQIPDTLIAQLDERGLFALDLDHTIAVHAGRDSLGWVWRRFNPHPVWAWGLAGPEGLLDDTRPLAPFEATRDGALAKLIEAIVGGAA